MTIILYFMRVNSISYTNLKTIEYEIILHYGSCEFNSHTHWGVLNIQLHVIKFVSDLRLVHILFSTGTKGSFTNKTDRHNITEIKMYIVESDIKQQLLTYIKVMHSNTIMWQI